MKIFVVRHGQTNWNSLKKMQGSADISLNENGIKQAEELSEKLKSIKFDIIISSPLQRAKQTSEIINRKEGKDLIFDERLKARDYGEFEGIQKTDFDYNEFWDYSKNIKYKKAENIQDFYARIESFIKDIKKKLEVFGL